MYSLNICTNIRKYDIKTLTYLFMEDVYSWMRSTHEFPEIEAPQNLMISQFLKRPKPPDLYMKIRF